MTFQSFFVWFYCLPISDAVLLIAFFTLVFLFLNGIFDKFVWWKCAVGIAVTAWIAVIIYATLTGREASSGLQYSLIPFHSYQAVMNGGNPEILRSNFMNAVLFYPAGLLTSALLPAKWPRWSRILLTLALFATVSAGIECVQYVYALGRAEIDDVIHNAFGALLGGLLGVIDLNLPPFSPKTE